MTGLLELADVRVVLPAADGLREVIHHVSLSIDAGEAVGLVGESGSGKSMTAKTVMRLLPAGAVVHGTVRFDGRDVLAMDSGTLRQWRLCEVAMIFQDPRAHTNPVRRIGDFLTEGLIATGSSHVAAVARAVELLEAVRVPRATERMRQYPHQLSGGLLQRVMIAAALTNQPRLLLADEPTTALDVTTQAEVMAILDDLRRDFGLALLLITHDLELAAATCTRTAVMYAGSIVEVQPSARLHDEPLHPYTSGLVAARPSIETTQQTLSAIKGHPIAAFEAGPGCAFSPRCPHTALVCSTAEPLLHRTVHGWTACLRSEDLLEVTSRGALDA